MTAYKEKFNERQPVSIVNGENQGDEYRLCEWRFQDPEMEAMYVEFKEAIDESDKGLSKRVIDSKEKLKISQNKASQAKA